MLQRVKFYNVASIPCCEAWLLKGKANTPEILYSSSPVSKIAIKINTDNSRFKDFQIVKRQGGWK